MTIQTEPLTLELETPFVIAHGASTTRQNVLLHLGDEASGGVGVAALTPYYPTTVEDVNAYAQDPALQAALATDPVLLHDALDRLPPGPSPARAACDMALHDRWGKHLGRPLYELWGLNPARAPVSSYTIGMAEEDEFRRKVRAVAHLPLLKLKIGTGDLAQDEALVRMAQEESRARLCIDANAAWTVEQALTIIPRLAAYNLLFIEQPLGQHDYAGWIELAARLPAGLPPLIADESIHSTVDVVRLAGHADGINIKLAKCGGLREAQRLIALARGLNMQILLGCMVESAVGISAAAHLAPLVDYADLDGNLTITNDPYQGVGWDNGRLRLTDAPGLGTKRQI